MAALFPLGQIVATPGALVALTAAGADPLEFLGRHGSGDWGDIDPEDAAENEYSIKHDFRIVSSYTLSSGGRVWLITEYDRSQTTVLLPSEY